MVKALSQTRRQPIPTIGVVVLRRMLISHMLTAKDRRLVWRITELNARMLTENENGGDRTEDRENR